MHHPYTAWGACARRQMSLIAVAGVAVVVAWIAVVVVVVIAGIAGIAHDKDASQFETSSSACL